MGASLSIWECALYGALGQREFFSWGIKKPAFAGFGSDQLQLECSTELMPVHFAATSHPHLCQA